MNKRHEYKRNRRSESFSHAYEACLVDLHAIFQSSPPFSIADIFNLDGVTLDTPFFSVLPSKVLPEPGSISRDDNPNLSQHTLITCNQIDSDLRAQTQNIDWKSIPQCLDPASGELDEKRSQRKRDQVSSLIWRIESVLNTSPKYEQNGRYIVDYGSGSGHLGLLLAYRNPSVHVILMERKIYSIEVATKRISECRLSNATLYGGDIRQFHIDYPDIRISMGISLHSCGLLTDYALEMCITHNADFVLVPCCYGQTGKPPPEEAFLTSTLHDSSKYRTLPSLKKPDCLSIVSSTADYSVGLEDDYLQNKGFLIAKRSMRLMDIDRLVRCMCANSSYRCMISSLQPLSCSPKNNIIIGLI